MNVDFFEELQSTQAANNIMTCFVSQQCLILQSFDDPGFIAYFNIQCFKLLSAFRCNARVVDVPVNVGIEIRVFVIVELDKVGPDNLSNRQWAQPHWQKTVWVGLFLHLESDHLWYKFH